MFDAVVNNTFLITDNDIIVVGEDLDDLLFKSYSGKLNVRDVVVDPIGLEFKDVELSKIVSELFKKCPKKTYSKFIHSLLEQGFYVFVSDFLKKLDEKWDYLKFSDLTIKYKSPYSSVVLSIHINQVL